MQKNKYLTILIVLSAGIVLLSGCAGKFEKLRRSGSEATKYKAAIRYYKKQQYDKASILFEELVPIMKGDSTQEIATFYQAYCDYYTANYTLSSYKFKKFAETFARSSYAEEAVYMSAYSLYKDSSPYNLDQASTLTAIDELQSFVNNYSESPYRDDATNIIKELRRKLELKAFERAKLYYQTSAYNISTLKSAVIAINNFQKDFPDSKYSEEMAFLKIKSEYELAQKSFDIKQKERFAETILFYQAFIDKYPNSKFLKQAEALYATSQQEVERIAALEKKAKETPDPTTTKVTGATKN